MQARLLVPLCLAAGLLVACGPRDDTQATGPDAPGYGTGDSSSGATNDAAREAGATPGATTVPDTLPPSEETTAPDTTSAPDSNTPPVNEPTTSPGNQ